MQNIFNQRPIVRNKISTNSGTNCKNYYHQHNVHCTRTNLSTNFFLHLQFSKFKYSPTSHALSHSHTQLLGFQISPLSHTPLSINSLHSHLHLSLFQHCLLLQTLAPNLHSIQTFRAILYVSFH